MLRSSRQNWQIAMWLTAALLFFLFIVLPIIASFLFRYADRLPEGWNAWLSVLESLLSYLMLTFCAVWVVMVGGSFASFLNVVAWRVPRGRSILGSSHCPYCNAKLSFRDNVPIFGWIKNWGRCSTCRLPISPRYVLVEIALGLIFLAVTSAVFLTGGAILPIRDPDPPKMLSRMLLEPNVDLVAIVALHLAGILAIFTFLLIELERKTVPRSVYLVSLIFLVGIPLVWPESQLIHWRFPFSDSTFVLARVDTLINLASGISAGFLVGYVFDRILRMETNVRLAFGMSTVGAIYGWQSVVVVACVWVALNFAIPENRKSEILTGGNESHSVLENLRWSPNAKLIVALLLHLATWRWFSFLL